MADFVLDPSRYEGHTPGAKTVSGHYSAADRRTYYSVDGVDSDYMFLRHKADAELFADAPAILAEAIALRARVEALEATVSAVESALNERSYEVWTRDYGHDDVVSVEVIREAIELAKHKGEQEDAD